jgi:hypothetical protein
VATSPPINTVAGAVAWPKPECVPSGAGRPGIAAFALLEDVVRGLAWAGGCSILFASVAGTRVTTWAVTICPF